MTDSVTLLSGIHKELQALALHADDSSFATDWAQKSTNEGGDLTTALSKEATVSVREWDAVMLEPECTLLSAANAMNQSNGSASSVGGQGVEARMCEEEKVGIKAQLDSLEEHPDLPFSLENPRDSEFWDLDG